MSEDRYKVIDGVVCPEMKPVWGTYEYTGPQRCGKTTKMVEDLIDKILPSGFEPGDVWANFRIFIVGVNCVDTEELIRKFFEFKRTKVRHKVLMFDEVGQFLMARQWKDKEQSEAVNFIWQMPKRDIILLFCTNPGNSGDVILRLGAWHTVIPRFHFGRTRNEDFIRSSVSFNFDCRFVRGIITPDVVRIQSFFDSDDPVE